MKSKKWLFPLLVAEAAICLVLALVIKGEISREYATIMKFPFAQLGDLLRNLSLSSQVGNMIALILYILVGLSPIGYLAYRLLMKRKGLEDIFLPVLSILLFLIMYLMINPGLINKWIGLSAFPGNSVGSIGKATLGGVFYSVLFAYLVFRTIRNIEERETDRLLEILRIMFMITLAIAVFSIFYIGVKSLATDIVHVKDTNENYKLSLVPTYIFLVFQFILKQLPTIFITAIFLLAIRLVESLKFNRYSDDVARTAGRLSSLSKIAVMAIMVGNMGFNLLQLILSKALFSADYSTHLPIDFIVLTLVMLLFGRYFGQSKRLHSDSQLFI